MCGSVDVRSWTGTQASEVQQMAIERARPHLVALADETGEAINLVRSGRWNLRQPEYKETVADLY